MINSSLRVTSYTARYAVRLGATRGNHNVTILKLSGLVVDASVQWLEPKWAWHGNMRLWLQKLLTVHKLEPSEQVLSKNEKYEDEETVRCRCYNKRRMKVTSYKLQATRCKRPDE